MALCGRNIKKTFKTGLRTWENRTTALSDEGKATPFGGERIEPISRMLFIAYEAKESIEQPSHRMVFFSELVN